MSKIEVLRAIGSTADLEIIARTDKGVFQKRTLIHASSKPALLAALLEDAGAVKVSGRWMEEGCGSERIYEGIDIRTVPEDELGEFLKAERRDYWLLPIPEEPLDLSQMGVVLKGMSKALADLPVPEDTEE